MHLSLLLSSSFLKVRIYTREIYLSTVEFCCFGEKMQVLYLLCSILSTFVTSVALSLLLPLHALLRRWSRSPVTLYEGIVWHERRRPVRHSFQYSVRYALIDLDRAPHSPPGHLSADEAREFAGTKGRVLLLTIPPSVGYEQNPFSLYYCYERLGSGEDLWKCIAEVTNTPWGERVTFVFNPNSDLVAKLLHISPFMDMLGNWSFRANAPGDNIFVLISVTHPVLGDYFTAYLKLKKVLSSSSMGHHAMFFWLMPHKVALWIYWNAFLLWWKNLPFIQHPRYSNPAYREKASIRERERERELSCSWAAVNHLRDDGSDPAYSSETTGAAGRCFAWRDAKWPWA